MKFLKKNSRIFTTQNKNISSSILLVSIKAIVSEEKNVWLLCSCYLMINPS